MSRCRAGGRKEPASCPPWDGAFSLSDGGSNPSLAASWMTFYPLILEFKSCLLDLVGVFQVLLCKPAGVASRADPDHLFPAAFLLFFGNGRLLQVHDLRFCPGRPPRNSETGVVRPVRHVAGDTTRRTFGILSQFVNNSVERCFVHLLMGVVWAEMTGCAGFGVSCLFQRETVRGVAAVTSFLDNMAAFAEGRPDLRGDAEIFPVDPHPVPPHGMSALLELGKFFLWHSPHFSGKTMPFVRNAAS